MPAPAASSDPRAAASAITIRNLAFGWRRDRTDIDIAAFDLGAGERVFLRGPSGSGKSTLLSLIGGVITPRSGRIEVLGTDMAKLSAAGRDAVRASRMGVVFQMFNLVPYLTVEENVLLPCRFSSARRKRIASAGSTPAREAARLLERLGLPADIARRRASDLSVGQQQRVAVARALIGSPELILADEPTSALDTDAREAFIQLLIEECGRSGSSLLFVSHDLSLAAHFDRTADLPALNGAAAQTAQGEA